jgi:type IV secretory pathway VirB10-like protein
MSSLGKRRLGVSSPLPPSHTIYEPPKPLSRDLEDLESLIRVLADELERAEEKKGMPKLNTGGEGPQSPDRLATPVTASYSPISELGDRIVTPPPIRHREHTSQRASREERGSDEKARNARTREKSGVSASTGSDGKRTRSEKPRREKADDKRKPSLLEQDHVGKV